jgi:hypothetical protein
LALAGSKQWMFNPMDGQRASRDQSPGVRAHIEDNGTAGQELNA